MLCLIPKSGESWTYLALHHISWEKKKNIDLVLQMGEKTVLEQKTYVNKE